jgi:predicted NAD/FAD-dependent oxidoreductase
MQKKVLIIGSGIAGISSSLKLKTYGIDSVLVDKGRFLGGRISSREVKSIDNIDYFFHGAQFFTAKSDNFKKIIEQGIKNNFIEEFGKFNPPRYRGYKSMRNFLSNLTFNLNIKQNNTIINLKPNKKQISALDEKTKTWQSFDGVISTIPSPQNYDLMENFPKLRKTLITSSYDSCIAFMFSINKRPENFPIYFDLYKKRGILGWMASGSNLNLWTAHTKGSYANKNLNQNKNQLQNEIFSAIQKVFAKWENSLEVYFHSLHIWKYAKVKKISSGLQIDPDFPVALAGDFMEGYNIESAFISGEKAANLIFNRLNQVS